MLRTIHSAKDLEVSAKAEAPFVVHGRVKMSANEEEQVRAMLEAMGVGAATESLPMPELGSPARAEATSAPQAAAPTMSISEALSSIQGITERPASPPAAPSTPSAAVASAHGREMSLSTLVHLLGLSTSSQVDLLETQIETLSTKVSAILLKLDRIAADLGTIKGDAAIDRIDFQITEIRALLKRVVPAAAAAGDIETKSDTTKSASGRAKILTSEVSKPAAGKKPETKIVEPDNLEEFNKDDASFQAKEAARIRTEGK